MTAPDIHIVRITARKISINGRSLLSMPWGDMWEWWLSDESMPHEKADFFGQS